MKKKKCITYKKTKAVFVFIATLALCFGVSLTSCSAKQMSRSDLVLGTVCTIKIVDSTDETISLQALTEAFARLRKIDDDMSANTKTSYINSINELAGKQAVPVPDDVFYVIKKSIDYAKLSGGAFDPTVGHLVKLWNIGNQGQRVPTSDELKAVLPLINYKNIKLDDNAKSIFLTEPNMRLDLGAIAKGYAADEVSNILAKYKISAVIDLGGNIKVVGSKTDKSRWNIGIKNPIDKKSSYLAALMVDDEFSVVTSGIYERFFTDENGQRYHHILNTKTGYPINNGLVSVVVICKSSIDADGLSTTLFALGLEAGLKLAESLEQVDAIFIDAYRHIYMTNGAKSIFKLNDKSFSL